MNVPKIVPFGSWQTFWWKICLGRQTPQKNSPFIWLQNFNIAKIAQFQICRAFLWVNVPLKLHQKKSSSNLKIWPKIDFFTQFENVTENPTKFHLIARKMTQMNLYNSYNRRKCFLKSCNLEFDWRFLGGGEYSSPKVAQNSELWMSLNCRLFCTWGRLPKFGSANVIFLFLSTSKFPNLNGGALPVQRLPVCSPRRRVCVCSRCRISLASCRRAGWRRGHLAALAGIFVPSWIFPAYENAKLGGVGRPPANCGTRFELCC